MGLVKFVLSMYGGVDMRTCVYAYLPTTGFIYRRISVENVYNILCTQ